MLRFFRSALAACLLVGFLTPELTAGKNQGKNKNSGGTDASSQSTATGDSDSQQQTQKKGKKKNNNNSGSGNDTLSRQSDSNAVFTPLTGTLQGDAYGYWIDVDLLGAPYVAGPRPYVALPASGGTVTNVEYSLDQPGLITAPIITVLTSGAAGTTHATADSATIIDQFDLLKGLVTSDQVVSFSSSTGDGLTALSSSNGSEFVGLSIAGVDLGNLVVPANTVVPLPELGILILNRQFPGGNGGTTSSLSVEAVYVALDLLLSDVELLEDLIAADVLDIDTVDALLDDVLLDSSLLSELNGLGIVGSGPLTLIQSLLGGSITVEQLDDLLNFNLTDELLERDALDLLLSERLDSGLLDADVLQLLLEDEALEPLLAFVLDELGYLNGEPLDVGLLEELIGSGTLSLSEISEFIELSGLAVGLPAGQLSTAWARSGVDAQPSSGPPGDDPVPPGSIAEVLHGVGKLGTGSDQAQFAIHVRVEGKKGKNSDGHVSYKDSFAGLKLHSHSITSANFDPSTVSVTFSGVGDVNDVGDHQFTVTVRDVSSHGTGNDEFSISTKGPSGQYKRSGTLSAGNLHLHPAK